MYYANAGYANPEVNKVVASKYQEDSKKEMTENTEHKNTEDKDNENLSDNANKTPTQPEKVESASTTKSQEDEKPVGTPIKAELTAYSNDPRCSDEWGSQTAMQTRTRLGVIAAPSKIPLGSKVYIPELKNYKADGMFDVEDRGGAIKIKNDGTYVIDVWVPTYEEAVKFGRKYTTIYLIQ